MKKVVCLCFISLLLGLILVQTVNAHTWYDEDGGEASITGSYYIGKGEYTTNTLLLGMRCIVWHEATAKGSMYVYGFASSTGPVTGSIYWYTKGNLAAGGMAACGASILIKFQAYDITSSALYEKVLISENNPWSDEGTWRWDSMSIPLYYGHLYKFSLYAEAHAYVYGIGSAISDFGGVWWEDSKIQWGFISVPNVWLVPPHTLTIASDMGGTTNPAPGTYIYEEGSYVRVEAIPNAGYFFDYWTLDGEIYYSNPIGIFMDTDHNLAAHFVQPVNLVVQAPQAPPEGVNFWIDGIAYTAYASTPVSVMVKPGQHTLQAERSFVKEQWTPGTYFIYTFYQWSDGSKDNPRTIHISSSTTLTAYYLRSKYGFV